MKFAPLTFGIDVEQLILWVILPLAVCQVHRRHLCRSSACQASNEISRSLSQAFEGENLEVGVVVLDPLHEPGPVVLDGTVFVPAATCDPFLTLAHRARCAAAIRALPAADIVRPGRVPVARSDAR